MPGVTLSDLIGRKLHPAATQQIQDSLDDFADKKVSMKSPTDSMPDVGSGHQCQSGPTHARLIRRRGRPQALRATGTAPAGNLRRSQTPRLDVPTHPNLRLPEILNAPTRHVTLPAPQPQRAAPPLQTAHHAKIKTTAGQDPTKFPHHTRHIRSHQHHAEVLPESHIRWSESRVESSRDRTRTYNLPVNRRSVPRGAICCCRSP
jgi:hypothetical protein